LLPIATEKADILQAELELLAELGQFATTLEGVDPAARMGDMGLTATARALGKSGPRPGRDGVEPQACQLCVIEAMVGNQVCSEGVPLGTECIMPGPELNPHDRLARPLHNRVGISDHGPEEIHDVAVHVIDGLHTRAARPCKEDG
jgi:hypothetical protein